MKPVKVGILAAGGIARRMAAAASRLDKTELCAVGSRSLEKAEAFARDTGAQKAYGSYEELLADPQVELVYVATPHSHHYQWAKAALEAGKHVLVEKAFTENARQAEEVLRLSEERGLFCGEALKPPFMPGAAFLRGLEASGEIGRITGVQAQIGFNAWDIQRLYDPALAGGALLDMGVYALAFATQVLGSGVEEFTAQVDMADTGVDRQETILLRYPGGKLASLYVSAVGSASTGGRVYGTGGYVVVSDLFHYRKILVYDGESRLVRDAVFPVDFEGFELELAEAADAIRTGRCEFAPVTHAETLRIMRLMDEIRRRVGFTYPDER